MRLRAGANCVMLGSSLQTTGRAKHAQLVSTRQVRVQLNVAVVDVVPKLTLLELTASCVPLGSSPKTRASAKPAL